MKPTSEADCEIKRLEILDNELSRLHQLLGKERLSVEDRAWAFGSIEEIQAVVIGSGSVIVPEIDHAYLNDDTH